MLIPRFYSHRLGRAYGPDSSGLALHGSLAGPLVGIGLETDVCLTADEELVLLHDPLLEVGTTLDGWARDRSAAEIRTGFLLDRKGEQSSERPLLLDEMLDAVPPELPLQLEVKSHADRELAIRTTELLCDHLERHHERRDVEVLSFFSEACAAAAARGVDSRLVVWADYAPEALAAWAHERGVSGVSVEHFLLSERLVAVMRLAGLSVNTGTVNHPALLARALFFGVDAVCTDRPHELRAETLALGDVQAAPRETALSGAA
jgi:glycerophosphoryl diester phosphodiesterase